MANIKINNLNPAGTELFTDSESFMTELSDAELTVQGGKYSDEYWWFWASIVIVTTVTSL